MATGAGTINETIHTGYGSISSNPHLKVTPLLETKLAVTATLEFTVKLQEPVPVQPPLQPLKVSPGQGWH